MLVDWQDAVPPFYLSYMFDLQASDTDLSGQDPLIICQILPKQIWRIEIIWTSCLAESAVDTFLNLHHKSLPLLRKKIRRRSTSDKL